MGLLAPLYIAGGLAIGLPILFHLIRRTPHMRQVFSSLMFLSPSPPRLTRRSRLNNILLLILRATALIRKGRSENGVARDVGAALQAQAGKRYNVEVDDGEDVLVKRHDGERKFVITIVENSVQGVKIDTDAE